ncbi:MAG: bifunctional homocysteine S-methyltransferase/methylenetetrahydrofolate reductase [Chloroflexi bacterium]|nr:MAG: bifunctional homocysteine S-methyltransferase/methylenetetrahydrofolate reductase [Chloroflexota bacterium]
MNRDEFVARLLERPLLLDGAMGAWIHAKGIPNDISLGTVNVQNPAIVAEIHQEYIEAGADILETNSFAANRLKLAEHGLQKETVAINQAAVDVARRVIAKFPHKSVLLAGSVGPLGATLAPLGRVSVSQAREAFREQIEALLSAEAGGVDLLILETMSDFKELKTAVTVARDLSADIPIIAQMTFTRDDRTLLGLRPDEVARKLAELDIDVMGVNCSTGPANVLRIVSMMHQAVPERPLSAAPNAGWPEQLEGGGVRYPATSAYFGEYARSFVDAGARIVGGCCGTRAEHIQAMRAALDNPSAPKRPLPTIQIVPQEAAAETTAADKPTQMAQDLAAGKFIITVEMSPPHGIATERLLAGARMLKEAGATMLNLADSPLARMHMSAWAAAHLVQQEVGVETVLHFPTRGRNLLRIQGDLLAAHAMGIRNLFVVMGDPTRIGDFPEAMDSYDIVPTGLIQLIKQQLNQGVDKAGRSIDQATSFTVGCAVSLTPKDPEREMRLLHKKIKNGADFALTQPVFDPAAAKQFIETYENSYEEPMLPLVTGIKPLYNSRNAEFLHHEVPGMVIPAEQRERMKQAKKQRREGVLIAQETLAQVKDFSHGTYLIPAFGRFDLIADIIDSLN